MRYKITENIIFKTGGTRTCEQKQLLQNDREKTITKIKSDTDLDPLERLLLEAEKNKNILLFWGITVQLAVGGLVVTLLQFLANLINILVFIC